MVLFPLLVLSTASIIASESPVGKVITLLEELKTKVEGEGKKEAGTYDKFACFCKETTDEKGKSIVKHQDKIDDLSASMGEAVATKETKQAEVKDRVKKREGLLAELKEAVINCQAESARFAANVADLTKADESLKKAIKALKKAKGGRSRLFLETRETVSASLALADAMSLVTPAKEKAVTAFLQQGVDPENPDYEFRSNSIIETLEKLSDDFTAKLDETNEERKKAKKACDETRTELTKDLDTNAEAMTTLKDDIEGLIKKIAEDREGVVNTEDLLKDDQLYMKDLTARCEVRARDWDQRASMRGGEVQALTEALAILKEGPEDGKSVLDLEKESKEEAKKRRRLLQVSAPKKTAKSSKINATAVLSSPGTKTPSFLQALQQRSSLRGKLSASQAQQNGKHRASEILQSAGIRLKNGQLSNLAVRVMADPFVKVKGLIQSLIDKLYKEAAQEATKKGWCNTQIGKAKNDRDSQYADITKYTAAMEGLEAKKEELELEMKELKEDIPKAWKKLNETTKLRDEEKDENLKRIKAAEDAAAAVHEAIMVLKNFYQSAEIQQVLLQASPVDEDTEGAGFKGGYKGKQEAGTGIISLLEGIKVGFEKSAQETESEEEKAHRDFVEFDQTQRADIKSKETQMEIDKEELKGTESDIDKTLEDTETAQGLLTSALKAIEELKPMCVDNGMSYKERQETRDEEIAALKKALCALDPNGAEKEC
mmetsp:Transcript_138726/g.276644  ORF Transcript_138726/g.276644 Transcript_138726/m.276644 type:complete len:717 (-) Transcript_138726:99-2249(-)